MIKATIIADSVSAHTNQRITTFELEYPRFIHSELMTHRQFSRNASSSRAIPIDKMIEQVQNNSAMPIHWGANQSGMQAEKELSYIQKELANSLWVKAKNNAVSVATEMKKIGLHKQVVNRVLEPFQMMKTLVTATNFDNFFNLRCHKDAQPEIKQLADLMYQAMQKSTPEVLQAGEWHTPYVHHTRNKDGSLCYFITGEEYDIDDGIWVKTTDYLDQDQAIKISCSCSAQVSYRKNDTSIEKALAIYDKLVNSEPVHASAFEHCATPINPSEEEEVDEHNGITHWSYEKVGFVPHSGNFTNWVQYRQLIPNHDCKEYKGLNHE